MTAFAQSRHPQPAMRVGVGRFVENLFGEIAIDLFAGGGGMSLAWEIATGRCVDEAVNHDANAIWMHRMNHRNTRHWRESVWEVDPDEVAAGRSVGWLHGSPDCTHFSIARGGKPVKKEIRGLAWCCLRWVARLMPRLFTMENVREFQTWGPLIQKSMGRRRWLWEITRPGKGKTKKIRFNIEGPHCDDGSTRSWRTMLESLGYVIEPLMIPDKSRSGETFKQWMAQLRGLGYQVEVKVLDAADYGAPTHRRRLVIVARRDGLPIRWPEKTHGLGTLKPYRTAAECVEFDRPCPSIFNRKKGLAENTLRRVVRGLVKFSIESSDPYIVRVDRGGPDFRGQSIHEPFPTICADHGFGLTVPFIGRCAHGETSAGGSRWGAGCHNILFPLGSLTASKDFCLISPNIIQYNGEKGDEVRGLRLDVPLNALPTENRFGLAVPFLYDRYGERAGQSPRVRAFQRPMGTITATANGGNLVMPFLYTNVIGQHPGQRIDRPLGTITTVHNKFNLLSPYLVEIANSTWSGGIRDVLRPMPTITARPKGGSWSLISPLAVKFYRTVVCQPLTDPLDTVTSRHRFGLGVAHLTKLRGSNGWCSIAQPIDTICAGAATFGLTTAWVVKHYGGNYEGAGIDLRQPLDTITAIDHHAMGTAFITHLRGTHGKGVGGTGLPMQGVLPTITGGGGHIYLTEARHVPVASPHDLHCVRGNMELPPGGSKPSTDGNRHADHLRVLRPLHGDAAGLGAARSDVGRGGDGPGALEFPEHPGHAGEALSPIVGVKFDRTIYTPRELSGPSDDPQINRGFWRVHDLMCHFLGNNAPLPIVRKDGTEYLIYDIGMRMLAPRELLNAQFSPELAKDYVLTGTSENQVAKIGNSVPPLLGAAVIAANWVASEMEAA